MKNAITYYCTSCHQAPLHCSPCKKRDTIRCMKFCQILTAPNTLQSTCKNTTFRQWQDSNLRGGTPADFESAALTPRPHCRSDTRKGRIFNIIFIEFVSIFILNCLELALVEIEVLLRPDYKVCSSPCQ